jgi:hypothetical protein
MGREPHHSLIVVHPPGCADADCLHAMLFAEMRYGTNDRILDGLRAMRGRWLLPTVEDLAFLVDHTSSDLGTTDVDADAEQRQCRYPGNAATRCRPEAAQPSTLFLRPLSALSMIVFSALRLNMPIMGMLMSTVSV